MLHITPWERQALQLLAQDKATSDISTCLGVPPSEVGLHLTALFARMGVRCQADAIADALRRGLLTHDGADDCIPIIELRQYTLPRGR